MLNKSKVDTVAIEREGQVYSAIYFVEHGVLYACLAGQAVATACTTNPYDQNARFIGGAHLGNGGKTQKIAPYSHAGTADARSTLGTPWRLLDSATGGALRPNP